MRGWQRLRRRRRRRRRSPPSCTRPPQALPAPKRGILQPIDGDRTVGIFHPATRSEEQRSLKAPARQKKPLPKCDYAAPHRIQAEIFLSLKPRCVFGSSNALSLKFSSFILFCFFFPQGELCVFLLPG